MSCNQTVICGEIIQKADLRYTPAGMAVTEFRLNHVSHQLEAGKPRRVECEIAAVALAELAQTAASLTIGTMVKLSGFLARKSRMSLQLVLHVNRIDLF